MPLLEQAERNLGTRGHISTIVIDRGYLDGEDLWQVHLKGVIFVVVSKANMTVTLDAQALAKRERVQARERVVRHGHGKTAREERLRTELVGIEGLTTYDQYGEAEQTQYAHRRAYEGQPINAVVVRRWNNRAPATDGTVYLTNGPVSDPFVVFDTYDWRSVIENGIFKEGKHPWHLGQFPKKTEAAVVVHCHFTHGLRNETIVREKKAQGYASSCLRATFILLSPGYNTVLQATLVHIVLKAGQGFNA